MEQDGGDKERPPSYGAIYDDYMARTRAWPHDSDGRWSNSDEEGDWCYDPNESPADEPMPKTKPNRSVGAAHSLTCLLIILAGIGYHGCTLRQPETLANMDTAMSSLPSGRTASRAISSRLRL